MKELQVKETNELFVIEVSRDKGQSWEVRVSPDVARTWEAGCKQAEKIQGMQVRMSRFVPCRLLMESGEACQVAFKEGRTAMLTAVIGALGEMPDHFTVADIREGMLMMLKALL